MNARPSRQAFGCKVTDRYGCEEVGLIACECERHAGLHLNIEHLYIEFLRPDGSPAASGEEGAIVITDLLNHGMPFIRYRIEDVGVPTERRCRLRTRTAAHGARHRARGRLPQATRRFLGRRRVPRGAYTDGDPGNRAAADRAAGTG